MLLDWIIFFFFGFVCLKVNRMNKKKKNNTYLIIVLWYLWWCAAPHCVLSQSGRSSGISNMYQLNKCVYERALFKTNRFKTVFFFYQLAFFKFFGWSLNQFLFCLCSYSLKRIWKFVDDCFFFWLDTMV